MIFDCNVKIFCYVILYLYVKNGYSSFKLYGCMKNDIDMFLLCNGCINICFYLLLYFYIKSY